MTMLYSKDSILELERYGIIDVFNMDTNIDGDFEPFCIGNNGEGILDIIMFLADEKMLSIVKDDILASNPYNSLDSWQQFSKGFLQEQLECEPMTNGVDTDRIGTTVSDVVNSIQDYGIKVERLMDNFLMNNEMFINIDDNEIWEDNSDGGFFNSLFGVYNKDIASYTLIDSDPIMQWAF